MLEKFDQELKSPMSALDVLRQIKQARRAQGQHKIVEWGNADYINGIGIENLSRRELRNHLEARDLDTTGTRLELLERLASSIADEQLHKFAYVETVDTEFLIQADLEERGSVYVAGINDKGQLGLGDMDARKFFTVVVPIRGINIVYLAAGIDMCYAVNEEHDVYVWGGGGAGRTGLNHNFMRKGNVVKENNWLEPQLLTDLAGEETGSVVVGSSHCLAVGRGGDCFVWGDGDSGQLGLGNFEPKTSICINNSFPAISQVSAGANHSAALSNEGKLYMWGHAGNGRLGVGDSERLGAPERERFFFPVPQQLRTLEIIKQVSCGADHTLAWGASGVWAWGSGAGGKLGQGDNKDHYEPVLVPKLRGRSILQVCAGTWHSMALVTFPPIMSGGWLYTWGSGYHGQLGQQLTVLSPVPEVVEYFVSVNLLLKMIATSSHHCMAVTLEGELYSWGDNKYGCLGR